MKEKATQQKKKAPLTDAEAIKSLLPGSGMSFHQFKEPVSAILQTFESPIKNTGVVTLSSKEMTALCPLTGFPDQYDVKISYVPYKKCLESKSVKHYLGAFRDYGGFIETIAQKIFDDVLLVTGTTGLKVDITMNPRGGVAIQSVVQRGL